MKRYFIGLLFALALLVPSFAHAQAIGQSGAISISAVTANQGTAAANPGWPVFVAPTSATANGLSNVVSSAVETGHVVKASAGNLYAFDVTTTTSTGGLVLIHNSTTVPAAGAVTPVKCYEIGGNQTVAGAWSPTPLAFSTGIAISFSTAATCFTQTNSATAFISADFL